MNMSNLVTKAVENIYQMDNDQIDQVVEAIKLKRTHLAKSVARSILIGDIVSFQGRRGQTVQGKVTKVNQKTIVVRDSQSQIQWKVTASMVSKLGIGA
jgi:ribosomal protein L35AE/L33A|tara:strand:- start:3 stop:296 length:294 start_codon:yes stop_codon:yes gene_type:complete